MTRASAKCWVEGRIFGFTAERVRMTRYRQAWTWRAQEPALPMAILMLSGVVETALKQSDKVGSDLIGLTIWAVTLGFFPTVACCTFALVFIWLAFRFRVASLQGFAAGGAVMALAEWIAITAGFGTDWTVETAVSSLDLIFAALATGAIAGLVWWASFKQMLSPACPT